MKKTLLLLTTLLILSCQPATEPKVPDEEIISTLKESSVELQDAILEKNEEVFKKYVDNNINFSTGDSNLSKFYNMNLARLNEEQKAVWNNFELYDINVDLSPNSQTAVLTFYARGSYTVEEGEPINYSTRGSSVWVSTKNGWKIMHSNWAPLEGGTGIPK
jgi:hypothetical protein